VGGKDAAVCPKAGKVMDAPQWVEQARKDGKDASVGRTSWEGWQAEIRTPHNTKPVARPR